MSETSVRAAAGWSSGAMVARYTRALSGELAVEEFQRSWDFALTTGLVSYRIDLRVDGRVVDTSAAKRFVGIA